MSGRANKLVLFALLGLVLFTGCRKKKEPTVTPQSQAPTISAPEAPSTAPGTGSNAPTPEPSTSAPATTTTSGTTSEPATVTTKPKPKPRAPKTARQKPPAQPATTASTSQPAAKPAAGQPAPPTATGPTPTATNTGAAQTQTGAKVVVPEGSDTQTSGQISAPGSNDDAHSRQTIEQLLHSTDTNLRSITRALTNDERAMVEQIRNYMTQARSASTDGDLIRANNLALKAHLLSDELVKR